MKQENFELAKVLALENAENEPAITEIYLFPSDEEIRLVELDPTAPSNEGEIAAFYFPPDPRGGIPLPSGIALIPPEEKEYLSPPRHWGTWDDAVLIYKKTQERAA